MKNLLSIKFVAICMLAFGAVVAFDSCSSDPCEDVTCVNGTPVESGDNCACECEAGWSGTDCTVEDKCITNDVNCLSGGTCTDGTCACVAGYEGDSCQIVSRDKFLTTGATVTELCPAPITPYPVDIVTGSDIDVIRIKNLGGYDCSNNTDYYIIATVSGNDITIATQVNSTCQTTFAGSGTLSGSNLSITYTATYDPGTGTVTDNCTASIAL